MAIYMGNDNYKIKLNSENEFKIITDLIEFNEILAASSRKSPIDIYDYSFNFSYSNQILEFTLEIGYRKNHGYIRNHDFIINKYFHDTKGVEIIENYISGGEISDEDFDENGFFNDGIKENDIQSLEKNETFKKHIAEINEVPNYSELFEAFLSAKIEEQSKPEIKKEVNLIEDKDLALALLNSGDLKRGNEHANKFYNKLNRCLKNDSDILLAIIKKYPDFYDKLDSKFKNDKEFILNMLKQNCNLYKKIDNTMKLDRDICLCIVEEDIKNAEYIPDLVKEDVSFVLKVFTDILLLDKVNNDVTLEEIYYSLKKVNSIYEYNEIKYFGNYPDFFSRCHIINLFLTEKILKNEKLVNSLLDKEYRIYFVGHRSDCILKNTFKKCFEDIYSMETIKRLLKSDSSNLEYVSDELKNKKEFVLDLLSLDVYFYEYLNPNLKDDEDILKFVIIDKNISSSYLSEKIKKTPWIIKHYLSKGDIFNSLYKSCKDEEYALLIMKTDPNSLAYFKKFQNNKKIVLEAIKNNPFAIKFASDKLKADKEVVSIVVSKNPLYLTFVNDKFKKDSKLVFNALYKLGYIDLKYENSSLKEIWANVKKSDKLISYIDFFELNNYLYTDLENINI